MANWRPSHAYVPGQTSRHPEDLFDLIKAGTDTMCLDEITGSKAWQYGLAFLDEGFYWEAHEVLEAVWMNCPQNSPEKLMTQAVIQTANARLKQKMGRKSAARRLGIEARRLAKEAVTRARGPVLGLDSQDMQYIASF
ncbi:DUF309 domain-containing protein [uncultured Ruegeria sp.]|uniref:DUF309 domain-containing protein n=1 Tax=uncultured Ruegeria sp. TaxID=259304 RepID=UPI00261C00BF|nr:DUF309 domain-containing protein [uncultured Ruegeria sp.]